MIRAAGHMVPYEQTDAVLAGDRETAQLSCCFRSDERRR